MTDRQVDTRSLTHSRRRAMHALPLFGFLPLPANLCVALNPSFCFVDSVRPS